jgi:hypothetical protein
VFSVAAWFPDGATVSLPYASSFPAPRRTGLGVLHHPAPSPSLSQRNRGGNPAPCRLLTRDTRRGGELSALRPEGGARRLRETREHGWHGQNPHSVGPCFTGALSQAATPLLDPHYQASTLVWMAPTSKHHRPCPRFLHLFTGARFQRTDARISLVTTCSQCQARHGLGPRGVPAPLARARLGLLPAGGTNPSALPTHSFRGSTPSRAAPPATFAPRLLSYLRIDVSVAVHAARLDTGLAAHDYPGGIPTR